MRQLEKRIRARKYLLFRHLPGRLGEYYERKHKRKLTPQEFEDALLQIAGMTCIDLGANFGKYTIKMSAHAGKVVAFEPDPESLRILQERTAGQSNITIKNIAAGTEDKSILLYRAKNKRENGTINLQASSVIASNQGIDTEHGVLVKQIDFVKYLEDLNENIGILKIDIEGAETDLLEALFAEPSLVNRIRFIFCETHERFIPSHKPRIRNLRKSSEQFQKCKISLDWH